MDKMERLGKPGGLAFPYLALSLIRPVGDRPVGARDERSCIVYETTMARAVELYRSVHGHEPYAIRQMSDNE